MQRSPARICHLPFAICHFPSRYPLSMAARFPVDPDITLASTLPWPAYTDPAIYQQCLDRVFSRSWQFIGDTDMVKVPTMVQPVTLLDGSLAEPLLLTRGGDDRIHCISNVCTHRGTILCD